MGKSGSHNSVNIRQEQVEDAELHTPDNRGNKYSERRSEIKLSYLTKGRMSDEHTNGQRESEAI